MTGDMDPSDSRRRPETLTTEPARTDAEGRRGDPDRLAAELDRTRADLQRVIDRYEVLLADQRDEPPSALDQLAERGRDRLDGLLTDLEMALRRR